MAVDNNCGFSVTQRSSTLRISGMSSQPVCVSVETMTKTYRAEFIARVKQSYSTIHIPAMKRVEVPMEIRPIYNELLEELHMGCNAADEELQAIFATVREEGTMKKLVVIICTVQAQWSMLSSRSNPQYILAFSMLKFLSEKFQQILNPFTTAHGQGIQPPVALQQED
ncbi:hypothetical protein CPB84DRAFT_88648 [Gymnopilus junonius]|uniref:Uncharacterized protein n=1 Tax=Gymnopilus junonius TaxID=109634 RepID=A0A9P5P3V3_GYMJU|nr:hypothetical protein CPB84DRAFT_88648 [Gymnopilus junonius]